MTLYCTDQNPSSFPFWVLINHNFRRRWKFSQYSFWIHHTNTPHPGLIWHTLTLPSQLHNCDWSILYTKNIHNYNYTHFILFRANNYYSSPLELYNARKLVSGIKKFKKVFLKLRIVHQINFFVISISKWY